MYFPLLNALECNPSTLLTDTAMSSTFKALYDNCATDVTNNIPSMYQDFYDDFDPFHTSVTGQYNAIQSVRSCCSALLPWPQ